jgi:hypothetical protein
MEAKKSIKIDGQNHPSKQKERPKKYFSHVINLG